VDKISKGDLDLKIDIKSRDEIGELASNFTHMIAELKKSRKDLENTNKGLQDQIGTRTKELVTKLKEAEDTKLATINILEDVDEEHQKVVNAQQQLKIYIEELKLLDKNKDEFISISAHELKTPLTSIHGFVDLLADPKILQNKQTALKYLRIVHNDTERLTNLVTNMLDLSRIDLGTMKLDYEKLNAKAILQSLQDEMDITIKAAGINSKYYVEPGMPDIICDKYRLLQVLSNLVNNAVHYTQKGGMITIKASRERDFLKFRVSDTGAGIPKSQIPKLFHRFYQVDSSLTRSIGGSGLGLAVCKAVVEVLGGKIWIESGAGQGTTVHLTIPIKPKTMKRSWTIADRLFQKTGRAKTEVAEVASAEQKKPADETITRQKTTKTGKKKRVQK
jgi:two-component system NtrC family sensor kinase